MKRVYVAGCYNAGNIIAVLDNIRIGMRASLEVLLARFSPFVPWFDFHFQLMLRPGEALTIQDYYDYSIAWLDVSNYMLVLEGWENSKGALAEIKRAEELNIPIFYSLAELQEHDDLVERVKANAL